MVTRLGYTYILTNKRNGTLYVGATSNIVDRMDQHKTKAVRGFTEKYNVDQLVWFERHDDIEAAIVREKQIKKWNRSWKIEMIEVSNPKWHDLTEGLFG